MKLANEGDGESSYSSDSESDIGLKQNLRDDWIRQQMYIKCQKQTESLWDDFTGNTNSKQITENKKQQDNAEKEKIKKERYDKYMKEKKMTKFKRY